jgi:tetratricopeptide (TPR) repeat protein
LISGNPVAAERVLRPGYEQLHRIGERALLSTTAGILAQALIEQQRDDEAWALTDVAEETAAADDLAGMLVSRTTRAQLLARRGEFDEADRVSLEALAIAERTDFLHDRGDAFMARGQVLAMCGRPEDAGAALLRARELYTRKGNTVCAERARVVMASLPRVHTVPQ